MNLDVKKIFKVLYFLLLAFIAAFCIYQGISNSMKSITDVESKTASVLISEFLSDFEISGGAVSLMTSLSRRHAVNLISLVFSRVIFVIHVILYSCQAVPSMPDRMGEYM